MLALKHMRNWSFDTLEREVRANLVYRVFTRVGADKVPDAKTLARIEAALGPEVFQKVQARIVGIAKEKKAVEGRRMRYDGHRNQYSLPHRKQSPIGRCSSAHSN